MKNRFLDYVFRRRSRSITLSPENKESRDLKGAFDLVYNSRRWTDQGNRSGPGSDPEACAPMCLKLIELIRTEKILSIVDVSCGGMAWWPIVLNGVEHDITFFGYDVSEIIIVENQRKFQDKDNWTFAVADARSFEYPDADLIVCRQTLNHLWRDDAIAVLVNIMWRSRRFVAVTNNSLIEVNDEDSSRAPLMPPRHDATCYTKLNLNIMPFDLASPIRRIGDVEGEDLDIFLSMYPPDKSTCIVSAFIGDQLDKVRQSPASKDESFFWANKEEFRAVIEAAGWTFLLDTSFAGDPTDQVQTSIRSKYFKFLQFRHDEFKDPLEKFRFALWSDAKRIPESRAAFQAFLLARKPFPKGTSGITIRTTPPVKESIEAEIAAAMPQERYARTMDRMRFLIGEEMRNHRSSNSIRICNTGLILFDLANPQVHELNKLIYDGVIATDNPECQILFALYRQRFSAELINVVPYEDYPSVLD